MISFSDLKSFTKLLFKIRLSTWWEKLSYLATTAMMCLAFTVAATIKPKEHFKCWQPNITAERRPLTTKDIEDVEEDCFAMFSDQWWMLYGIVIICIVSGAVAFLFTAAMMDICLDICSISLREVQKAVSKFEEGILSDSSSATKSNSEEQDEKKQQACNNTDEILGKLKDKTRAKHLYIRRCLFCLVPLLICTVMPIFLHVYKDILFMCHKQMYEFSIFSCRYNCSRRILWILALFQIFSIAQIIAQLLNLYYLFRYDTKDDLDLVFYFLTYSRRRGNDAKSTILEKLKTESRVAEQSERTQAASTVTQEPGRNTNVEENSDAGKGMTTVNEEIETQEGNQRTRNSEPALKGRNSESQDVLVNKNTQANEECPADQAASDTETEGPGPHTSVPSHTAKSRKSRKSIEGTVSAALVEATGIVTSRITNVKAFGLQGGVVGHIDMKSGKINVIAGGSNVVYDTPKETTL